ncbi:MAG: hypothetical protein ACR2O5_02775 [Thiogranum sp.]
MIRRSRSTRYTAASGTTGSDTDALQTDVMRFMSILGLCLMAVFALVQSIPLQEKGRTRPEPELEKLHEAIAFQQERARVLQADLKRLTAQMQTAQERSTSAQQALSSAQQQLTLVVEQTQQARSDRDRLTAELEVLRRRLAQGRGDLAGIQQAARTKTHSLRELQRQLGAQQKKLDDISQRTSALKRKKPPPPEPGPGKQGFTLRFASNEALHRLVAAGTVSLYGMAGKQAWRLALSAGSPVFAPDSFPDWFHEMAPSTVPAEYVRTLEKSVNRLAQSSLVWGVQLPPATKQGIASLTRGLQGGNLLIGADGQVTLEAE